MISREEYLRRVKMTARYQTCLNSTERKRMLADANRLYNRKLKREKERELFEKELDSMNETFLQGYIDGITDLDEDLLASIGNRYGKVAKKTEKLTSKIKKPNTERKPSLIDRTVDKVASPLTDYHTKKAAKVYEKKHGKKPSSELIDRFKKTQVAPATRHNLKSFAAVNTAASALPGPTAGLVHAPIVGFAVADEIKKNRQAKKARNGK